MSLVSSPPMKLSMGSRLAAATSRMSWEIAPPMRKFHAMLPNVVMGSPQSKGSTLQSLTAFRGSMPVSMAPFAADPVVVVPTVAVSVA